MHDRRNRGASWRRCRPQLAALVGVLALGLAVAACGSGGDKGGGVASLGDGKASAGRSNDKQMALNWARCMRQHGIDLPDPQVSGDDIAQQLPNRAVRNSPKFKAAEQACKQHLPTGAQAPPSAQERQQVLAFTRCMRQHGIDLSDPKVTANGIEQRGPHLNEDDPRLKAAERACHQYGSLPPPKPGGPQGGGGGK